MNLVDLFRHCTWYILSIFYIIVCANSLDNYTVYLDVSSSTIAEIGKKVDPVYELNRYPLREAAGGVHSRRDVHVRKRRFMMKEIKALSGEEVTEMYMLGLEVFQNKYGRFPPGVKYKANDQQIATFVQLGIQERKRQESAERERQQAARNQPPPIPPKTEDTTCRQPQPERPLVAYSGMKVKLDCKACSALPAGTSVSWEFQVNGSNIAEPMDYLKGARSGYQFEDYKKRLVFKSIRPRNTGKYFCKQDGSRDWLGRYDITVVTEPYFNLIFESRRDQPYAEETAVDGTTLFTHWSEWTGCNHCGEWGEKFRFGYCFARYRLEEYPEGVPCRSNVLSYSKRQLFSQRRDEKIIRECEEACPRGKQGNSMSESKAMETYYVDFDLGRPSIPPEVEKQVLYVDEGGSIQLLCPGGGLQDAIRWHNGSQHLRQTRPRNDRVRIDAMHVLHINDITPQDAEVYTCYHNRVRVASMTLNVVKPVSVNKKVKNNLMFVGIALTGLVGVIIWVSVYKNRKRHSFDI